MAFSFHSLAESLISHCRQQEVSSFLSCVQTGTEEGLSLREVAEVPLSGLLTSDDLARLRMLPTVSGAPSFMICRPSLGCHGESRAPLDPSP